MLPEDRCGSFDTVLVNLLDTGERTSHPSKDCLELRSPRTSTQALCTMILDQSTRFCSRAGCLTLLVLSSTALPLSVGMIEWRTKLRLQAFLQLGCLFLVGL